jgi:hypothetical protein
MSENMRAATPLDRPAPNDARLIVNESAAVVLAPPSEAPSLYERFRKSGLPCSHLAGHCGVDIIDFGSPSADQERLIRTVFDSWRKDADPSGESSLWCAWLSMLVVAIWIVWQLSSW